MSNKRTQYTAAKKSKIAIAAIEGKLTQAQITSEYGVHVTQIKTWKEAALKAINDTFSGMREKENKSQAQLVDDLYREIGHLQAQLSWLKKKYEL
jgi:transposase